MVFSRALRCGARISSVKAYSSVSVLKDDCPWHILQLSLGNGVTSQARQDVPKADKASCRKQILGQVQSPQGNLLTMFISLSSGKAGHINSSQLNMNDACSEVDATFGSSMSQNAAHSLGQQGRPPERSLKEIRNSLSVGCCKSRCSHLSISR